MVRAQNKILPNKKRRQPQAKSNILLKNRPLVGSQKCKLIQSQNLFSMNFLSQCPQNLQNAQINQKEVSSKPNNLQSRETQDSLKKTSNNFSFKIQKNKRIENFFQTEKKENIKRYNNLKQSDSATKKLQQKQPEQPQKCVILLNRYKVLRRIGQGSFAQVFEAELIPQQIKVAIKAFPGQIIEKKKLEKIIQNEVQNLKFLSQNGIIKFFESFEDKGNYFIVMELINGISLSDFIQTHCFESMSQALWLDLMRRLNRVLLKLHSINMSHWDLKCDNIIVDFDSENNQIKNLQLIDFGFSVQSKNAAEINQMCGTPNYMAPEIFNSTNIDLLKSDVWSLGVVFYKIFTKKDPFKHKKEDSKLVTNFSMEIFENVPQEFRQFLQRILQMDPEKRIGCFEIQQSLFLL